MQFLAKFFNQPALWAWAVVMILVIGLLVYKTPGLLMVKGGASLFGAWVEAPEVSYADSGIPNNQSFFCRCSDKLPDFIRDKVNGTGCSKWHANKPDECTL